MVPLALSDWDMITDDEDGCISTSVGPVEPTIQPTKSNSMFCTSVLWWRLASTKSNGMFCTSVLRWRLARWLRGWHARRLWWRGWLDGALMACLTVVMKVGSCSKRVDSKQKWSRKAFYEQIMKNYEVSRHVCQKRVKCDGRHIWLFFQDQDQSRLLRFRGWIQLKSWIQLDF